MKKNEVVKKSRDFDRIIKLGKSVSNEYFKVYYTIETNVKPKFGLAIGKKLGNAVTRNKIKRQVRTIITNNKFLFQNNFNYIIMVRKAFIGENFKILEDSFKKLIEKVNK